VRSALPDPRPAITTIIPTFRRPHLLRRAIESVLAQNYREVAVRVYDNASGDETAGVVAAIAAADPRVSYIGRARNVGAAENFILASADVSTPLCSFLSDDDYLLPGFFELAVAALSEHPDAGLFAGSTLEVDESGYVRYAPLAFWPREGVYEPADAVLQMLDNRHPTWTGVIFRTSALRAAGGLDRGASAALDFDAELRVAIRFPIVVSFAPCAAYVSHAASVSAGESAALIPSYEHISATLAAAETLPAGVRRAAVARFARQLRLKLVEIGVKAQMRGDAQAARGAATLLRDTYGSGLLGAALGALNWTCARVPAARPALRWLEGRRIATRARRARRFARRSIIGSIRSPDAPSF